MKLIYGTYNNSKLDHMKEILEGLEIEIESLNTLGYNLKEAEENFKEPLLNAKNKALTYYRQIKRPLFSCDSGLYFENVTKEDQPGVFIKRIHGRNLNHKDMLLYYSKLSAKYGGKLTAYYKNSICLILNDNAIYKYDGDDLHSEKFYIVETPHESYKEGFPLDSLSVEIASNKYYYDLKDDKSKNSELIKGFRDFFSRSLKL